MICDPHSECVIHDRKTKHLIGLGGVDPVARGGLAVGAALLVAVEQDITCRRHA